MVVEAGVSGEGAVSSKWQSVVRKTRCCGRGEKIGINCSDELNRPRALTDACFVKLNITVRRLSRALAWSMIVREASRCVW
jgi:hypothetical protein